MRNFLVSDDGDFFGRDCQSKEQVNIVGLGNSGCRDVDYTDEGGVSQVDFEWMLEKIGLSFLILQIEGTLCWCSTDDCNKGHQCDCSSSTTIGISALTLLVSAFIYLEMK